MWGGGECARFTTPLAFRPRSHHNVLPPKKLGSQGMGFVLSENKNVSTTAASILLNLSQHPIPSFTLPQTKRLLLFTLLEKKLLLTPHPSRLILALLTLIPHLVNLFNSSSGFAPVDLTSSAVPPLLQLLNLDPTDPSSYPPISLMAFSSKIL